MTKAHLVLFFLILSFAGRLFAEGSVDFIDYPGYRLFLRADKDQQMKAFARAGEYLNFGSSHVGFEEGFITVYRPDGSIHSVYDGSNGTEAIIYNNVQEQNGPTGGETGYNPGIIEVGEGEEGVWSFVFSYPTTTGDAYTNILNNAPWTRAADQPTNRRVILAWDITVTKDATGPDGGTFQQGRVYANEYNSMISENGVTTSPLFYVLTPDGLLYSVEFNETDPWGFPITSSSYGMVNYDGSPTYQSWETDDVVRSDNPEEWAEGSIYQYEPQAEDYGSLINNKLFFNLPDVTMPQQALVTDVFRNNTHATWLYKEPFTFDIEFGDFSISASDEDGEDCNVPGLQYGQGAYFVFDSNSPGNVILDLDLNADGDMEDPVDRKLYGFVQGGVDSIYWDGKDGEGYLLPIQDNLTFTYQFFLRGGENHITLSDVENNQGGIVFTLLSEVGAVDTQLFYYDHTPVEGPVSGGGAAGNALPTSDPYTYGDNWGNRKALDYWAYVVYGDAGDGGAASVTIPIVADCTDYTPPDSDGDGLTDDIDIDDDNDGIPDAQEFCDGTWDCLPGGFDPSGNEDEDAVINYLDSDDPAFENPCIDANENGVCDNVDKLYDRDKDGVPDHLDLDSDNDGISDLIEAGHGKVDADQDGRIDGEPAAFGANGFFNELASDPDDFAAVANYTLLDTDEDGVINADDSDSDNDGIYDVMEASLSYVDPDNDGVFKNSPLPVELNGMAFALDSVFVTLQDSDNDGYPDYIDLDSDNDTYSDVGENGGSDPDNDGFLGTGTPVVNEYGVVVTEDAPLVGLATSVLLDSDMDGVANFRDLDSDNDGIHDVTEIWASVVVNDPDNDGIGGYGLVEVNDLGVVKTNPDGTTVPFTSNPEDSDNDDVPDVLDLDSDNDSIYDVIEVPASDPELNGNIGLGIPVVNEHGQAIEEDGTIMTTSVVQDTDNDTVPNYRDLDSDNDGINDVEESERSDSDDDGQAGIGTPSVNEFGLVLDADEELTIYEEVVPDTDGDGIRDFLDLDSDNDGINDVAESGFDDADNDGIIGEGMPNINDKGQAVEESGQTATTSHPIDTDSDGVYDYYDLDSDNDGINDVEEANLADPDNDGYAGEGVMTVNENGQIVDETNTVLSTSNPVDTDGDNYPNYVDLDTDNDGINDTEEAAFSDPDGDGFINTSPVTVNGEGQAIDATTGEVLTISNPKDYDNDGVADYCDLDADNDGINDIEEIGGSDPDNDGITGAGAPAVNEFGQTGGTELSLVDTDGDSVYDYHDLDSDDDGINDVLEAGFADADNDGIIGEGMPTVNESGQAIDAEGMVLTTSMPLDSDNDDYPNYQDYDSDNDGINDVEEIGLEDPDNDGRAGVGVPPVNENGQVLFPSGDLASTSNVLDTDGDEYPNFVDLDSDNDGINDVTEAGIEDEDMDGFAGTGTPVVNDHGQPLNTAGNVLSISNPVDNDDDGLADYKDLDADNDGINDVAENGGSDPNNDGIIGEGDIAVNQLGQPTDAGDLEVLDSDEDGIPNYNDLDSDNDGINDVAEAGFADADNDGIIGTGVPFINLQGQAIDETGGTLPTSQPDDTDGDNYPDFIDLDSDNDGINDVTEAGLPDADNDGILGVGTPSVNGSGQVTDPTDNSVISMSDPLDTDGDGHADYKDLDSDNDGINDVEEVGLLDPDNDGIPGVGLPFVNSNGQIPSATVSTPQDTDSDTIPDYLDLDSDNDGINDVEEGGNEDPDNDGIIGSGTPDVNEEGQAINPSGEVLTTSNPTDTDNDDIPDYQDLDADNDGIKDVTEAGHDDPDNDGIVGEGTPSVNENGQTTDPSSTSDPVDSDGDGYADYQDLDSDNDGINDVEEAGHNDPDNDGFVGVGTPTVDEHGLTSPQYTGLPIDTDGDMTPDYLDMDSDNDGINDVIEGGFEDPDNDGMAGESPTIVNDNGQPVLNTSNPVDTDGDGAPDYQDLDSDGDGIPDADECPDGNPCPDWDNDGIPDFLDIDSDNDGIVDGYECETGVPCPDTDGDGLPDLCDWDTDGDGLPDIVECPNGAPCPDSDGDGIPDWRDPGCNGLTDLVVTNLTTAATYCEGETVTFTATTEYEFEDPIVFSWNGALGSVYTGVATSSEDFTYTIETIPAIAEGPYSLSLQSLEGCSGTSESVYINVIARPNAPEISIGNQVVCEGSTITLSATPYSGENVVYRWLKDGNLFEETTVPTVYINDASAAANGEYSVYVFDGYCPSGSSNLLSVVVVEPVESIVAQNVTSAASPACAGSDVLLSVPYYEGATYQWYGPNGLVEAGFEVSINNVDMNDVGSYYAIVTFSECGIIYSSNTEVYVADENVEPILSADNNEVCKGETVELMILNNLNLTGEATFIWSNVITGEVVAETTEQSLLVENLAESAIYNVVVTTGEGCTAASANYAVTVNAVPNEVADVPERRILLCEEEVAVLTAILPTQSTGRWTSLGVADVLNNTQNVAEAVNLVPGENDFIWTLSTPTCADFSTDTITVITPEYFALEDDFYTMNSADRLEVNVADNDAFNNVTNLAFSIGEEPNEGTVTIDNEGNIIYSVDEAFSGQVSFTYEVCNLDCPNVCKRARVTIFVNEKERTDCFIPSGITPNGDDKNDVLEIPCLNSGAYPDNNIMIFNRWGDKVYSEKGYMNDWGGTYKGKLLPAGTYFFILQLEPGANPIQDFFTIIY